MRMRLRARGVLQDHGAFHYHYQLRRRDGFLRLGHQQTKTSNTQHKHKKVDLKVQTNLLTKVTVFAAKIVPGDLFVVPWGWAVAEQSLNHEVNSGIRWVDMREEGTPGLRALISNDSPQAC